MKTFIRFIKAFGKSTGLGLLILFSICWSYKPPVLQPGNWRAAIERPDGQQIIFNFETKDSLGKTILYVINGAERLLVDSIVMKQDSVYIHMPFFESAFMARLTPGGDLAGEWIKDLGKTIQRLPFRAYFNKQARFESPIPAVSNISGRWAADFVNSNGKVSQLVGEFVQEGARLTGTFLDPTGDFRFLEGVVSGDSLKLSAFDGGHAYLFTAKIDNTHKISGGKFYSGARGIQEWTAIRDEKATIPDGYHGTQSIKDAARLNFSFPRTPDGKLISSTDKEYTNKVVVVQLLGSWCPNCMDETQFLSDYYKKNKHKGVEVIGIAYERTTDFKKSVEALRSFRERLNVQYPILVTDVAVSDTLRAEKTLPRLGKIDAFPTTIFLDKKGQVRKIHKGYSGPATGEHYEVFKKAFEATIEDLLAE